MSSFRLQETIRPTLTTPLNTCLSRRYETDVCAVTGKLYVKFQATRDYPFDLNHTTKHLSLKEIEIDVCAVTGKLYVKLRATRDYPSDLNFTTKHLCLKEIEIDNTTNDVTFEQILPVSLVGSDYVTFPSLPADKSTDFTDLFSAVAVFNDTLIQVPDYNITLDKAGDVGRLNLSASGFHHVTGNKPFYLYAQLRAEYSKSVSKDTHLNGPFGLCSVKLLPQSLWRSVYTLHVSGPLLAMEVYIAMVVEEEDHVNSAKVKVWDAAQTEYIPTTCQAVEGTRYVGCYLKLPPKRQVCSIGDPQKPPLAAYVFARTHGVATCYQMGVRENLAPDTDFNAEDYLASLRPVEVCPDSPQTPTEFIPTTEESSTTETSAIDEDPPIAAPVKLEEAITLAKQIKKELKIDVKTTSSFQRKKQTAGDFRTGSVSLGVISLVLVSLPFCIVILVDLHSLVLYLKKFLRKHRRRQNVFVIK
ncbi:hypothetical protein RRG08_052946 [Elysia crispata]|uniref:IgGFc-binding protein N-terminal domain-containing protein n=1 Tax=Elysia crispata TaxID=231223 RepID=A0AAE1EDM3_9GAST|nr:hypothetical protein RRG08_052946 [Elysia crispata]